MNRIVSVPKELLVSALRECISLLERMQGTQASRNKISSFIDALPLGEYVEVDLEWLKSAFLSFHIRKKKDQLPGCDRLYVFYRKHYLAEDDDPDIEPGPPEQVIQVPKELLVGAMDECRRKISPEIWNQVEPWFDETLESSDDLLPIERSLIVSLLQVWVMWTSRSTTLAPFIDRINSLYVSQIQVGEK